MIGVNVEREEEDMKIAGTNVIEQARAGRKESPS